MKNIHIVDDDINSLGLSNNICFSVFKEERRWVCKNTHLGRYALWWEAEGFRARDGSSFIMQNQLFVWDFSAAVSYWKFILAKFIPVIVPVPIVKFFPLGKFINFPRISIANNLRALRIDNIIILIKARTLLEKIISNIPQIQLGKKTEKRKRKKKTPLEE